MTSLRLLADDLTGALDSAAEFVALTGPVQAFWHGAIPSVLPANAALDSGTREVDAVTAAAVVHHMAPHFAGGDIAFKKIDSLLRGHTIAELAACMRGEGWRYCALAPAFPYQARVTRAGRQYARDVNGDWLPAGDDIVAALLAAGIDAQPGRLDTGLSPGISVFDADTGDDLLRVVAAVRRCPHRVLWSGTGGLAQALAAGAGAPALPPLPRPILGLFGSDQTATAVQLAACEPHWTMLPDGGPASAERIAFGLATAGVALASFDLPFGTSRKIAAGRIARQFGELTRSLPPPGTLIVAGGETLRSLCQTLGATSLEVHGRIVPGVPRSVMVGGRWNGVTVVSKSGAFGHPHLLRDLITAERNAS
jgi:D-threonate/D-erythronate kinase